jgi:UDP:flavonoid glycosyltransferase YjiC (YdhE family)
VVSSGGQQLIGEARYFGKPLLVVPMPKQHEQEINAHFAQQEGLGEHCPIGQLSPERVQRFLRRRFVRHHPVNGVDQVLDLLRIGHG